MNNDTCASAVTELGNDESAFWYGMNPTSFEF